MPPVFQIAPRSIAVSVRGWKTPVSLAMAALLSGFSTSGGTAQTLAERLEMIEGHLAASNPAEALRETRQLYIAVAQITGLQLSPPVLVTAAAPSLGVYVPRDSRIYTGDAPVLAYAEATGFTLQPLADGQSRVHLRMAFRVIDSAGRDRSGLVSMGEVDLTSRAFPTDVFLNLTYQISGVKGQYVLRTEVTDAIGGTFNSFDLPVVFQ